MSNQGEKPHQQPQWIIRRVDTNGCVLSGVREAAAGGAESTHLHHMPLLPCHINSMRLSGTIKQLHVCMYTKEKVGWG